MLLNRRDLLRFSLSLVVAWAVISGLLVFIAAELLMPLLPLFKAVIVTLIPAFSPAFTLTPSAGGGQLQLTVMVLSSVHIASGVEIPKGVELTASTHVLHVLMPAAIMFSVLLTWPLPNWRKKTLLLSLGLPVSLLQLLATVPVLLLALLEMPFQEQAMAANARHTAPWFMDWMIFCETGGALLLALVGVWLCLALVSDCGQTQDTQSMPSISKKNHKRFTPG